MNRVILLTLFCQHTKKITLLYIFVAGNIIIRNIKWLKLKLSGQHTCLLRKEDLRQNKSLLQSIPLSLSLVLLESSKNPFDLKHKNASYTKCLFQIFYCCSLRQRKQNVARDTWVDMFFIFWSILQLTARIIALSSPFYANCTLQRVNL